MLTKEVLEDLISQGLTLSKIAEMYHISRPQVSDYKKQYGIVAEPNGVKGQVPYGWFKNSEGLLVEESNEQENIQFILEKYNKGLSLRGICEALNENNIATKNNNNWHPNTIKKIVNREHGFQQNH